MEQHDESRGWESELERLGAAVRPAEPVGGALVERVRRRRARRRTAGVVGAAACAAAVVVSVSLVSPGGTSSAPPATAPTSSLTKPASPYVLPLAAGCGDSLLRPVPPLPDLENQERIAADARAVRDDLFVVKNAKPSPLGVIAMVEGDLDAARSELTEVSEVSQWFTTYESYYSALQDRIQPVVAQLRQQLRTVPGSGAPLMWSDAGAIIIQSKAPLTSEVRSFAGVRPDGITVYVQPVQFNNADLEAALAKVRPRVEADLEWTGVEECYDLSGIQVALRNELDPDEAEALTDELSDLAGVPVFVRDGVVFEATTG